MKPELLIRNTVLFFTLIAAWSGIYALLFACFSIYLVAFAISTKSLNARVCSVFFIAYYAIPFLNISDYRGTISFKTLAIYSAVQFCLLQIFERMEKSASGVKGVQELTATSKTQALVLAHLAVIYIAVGYVYVMIGPIIVRQDLRFTLPPALEYLIKSGLALPLAWAFSSDFRLSLRSILVKVLMPIAPSILIGSRGTFIMILMAVAVALHLFKRHGPATYWERFSRIYEGVKIYRVLIVLAGVAALYSGFYIRRDGYELLRAKDLVAQHSFTVPIPIAYAILPIYIGLREGPGISNRIIEEGIRNPTEVPLFFSELLTPLPGHQEAPGIVLARDVYHAEGADEKYSLTPGAVGGIWIDYGPAGLILLLLIGALLVHIYNRGLVDLRYRAIYCLSVVQFFHLYHRGFLKVEYFVPYFVLGLTIMTMRSRVGPRGGRDEHFDRCYIAGSKRRGVF